MSISARSKILTLGAVAVVMAPGCTVLHNAEREPAPAVPLPQSFSIEAAAQNAEARWWMSFEAPELDEAIDLALQGNLGLAQAFTRLDQAKAALDGAAGGYWPTVTAEASTSRARLFFNPMVPALTSAQHNASIAATYEVDLWGRVHSLKNAAELDYVATNYDVQAAVMSLTAQVAQTWFQLQDKIASEALLLEQVKRNETQLELMELRFGQGLANAVDVFQQRQALAASKTQLPPVRGAKIGLRNSLSVLLGRMPGSGLPKMSAEIPALSALPALGVPADLVSQRPDVKSAQVRVAAADYRVGAALADRFPTLRLTASAGLRAFDIADLFDDWLWNLVGGIAGPIFDGGRLAANQRLAQAKLQDRVAGYAQVVLSAFSEVEDALAGEAHQTLYIEALAAQLDVARMTEQEAYVRYVNGLSEYLPVLTALREVQALERVQIGAHTQLLTYRIQLCRALGGSWMSEVAAPVVQTTEAGE